METVIWVIALIVIILLSILAAEVYGIQDEEEQEGIRKENKNMLVKIVKVKNLKAKHREGQIRELMLAGNRAELKYVDGSGKYCITSQIKKITIETQNTTYELEVLEEKEDEE